MLKAIAKVPPRAYCPLGPALSVRARRHVSPTAPSFHNQNRAELDGSIREHNLHPAAPDWLDASSPKPAAAGRLLLCLSQQWLLLKVCCGQKGRAGAPEENLDVIQPRDAEHP